MQAMRSWLSCTKRVHLPLREYPHVPPPASRAKPCSREPVQHKLEKSLPGRDRNTFHLQAVRCPHANFVVQRLIVALWPGACQ